MVLQKGCQEIKGLFELLSTPTSCPILTLDVVLLPGLAPEHEDGDAGCDAAQDHVQQPGLAQVLGHVVDLAAAAPESEAA